MTAAKSKNLRNPQSDRKDVCPCGLAAELDAWESRMRTFYPDNVMLDSLPRREERAARYEEKVK